MKMRSWLGRGKSLQLGVNACCVAAFILYGWEQGVFGPILKNEDWLDLFNHPSDSATGIIVSCYSLGCLLGCAMTFLLGERLGRRWTIWIAMSQIVIGTALQVSAYHIAHLIVGRVVTGMGTGLKTSTVPMYQSELCPPTTRGRLVSADVMFVGIGINIAYWFNFGMSYVGGPIAWRLPISIQALFAIGVIFLVFALPESPRWLFNHGRQEEAIEVLCLIYDKDPTDPVILAERSAIQQAIALESIGTQQGQGFFSVFKQDRVRTGYRIFLAWFIQFMNQASGINLIVYYIPVVLQDSVGLTGRTSSILGGFILLMFVVGGIWPSLALDRMGRRKTMMWGCGVLGVSMLFIACLLSQADKETARGQKYAIASVAFFFVYMLGFGSSVNCVPWVYVPEILPLEARTRGTAIGVSSNWLWNFAVAMITPVILNRLGWKAYLIFTATNLASIPFVYFLYRRCIASSDPTCNPLTGNIAETSNLRLEDVDFIFSSGGDPVTVAKELQSSMKIGLSACNGNSGEAGLPCGRMTRTRSWG
ncbi:hexose carrier protein, partial [Colletotrichum asianum]